MQSYAVSACVCMYACLCVTTDTFFVSFVSPFVGRSANCIIDVKEKGDGRCMEESKKEEETKKSNVKQLYVLMVHAQSQSRINRLI